MSLLTREDYPDQLPRPEPVLAFQQELWDKSRDVAGTDIAWGDDIYQRVAIYPAPEPTGAVLAFIHGGRWTSGHKEAMAFMAPGLHASGITFASLGHRLAPHSYEDGFPDLCNGLACLSANVDRFGGDPGRIFVGGHSSGGHYAAQLAAAVTQIDDDEIRARVRTDDGEERPVEAEMILPEDPENDGPVQGGRRRTRKTKKKRPLGRK